MGEELLRDATCLEVVSAAGEAQELNRNSELLKSTQARSS